MRTCIKGTSRAGRKERELCCETAGEGKLLYSITFENSKQEIVVDSQRFVEGWEEYKRARSGIDVDILGKSPEKDNEKQITLRFKSGELHFIIRPVTGTGATIAINPITFESDILRKMGLMGS